MMLCPITSLNLNLSVSVVSAWKLDGGGYKTFRFNFRNWPWCPGGVKTEDLDRKLIVNDFTGKERLYSNFRTLYDAPEWTKDEVKCIDRIVREEGMKKVRA
jgi:hypothetical protein